MIIVTEDEVRAHVGIADVLPAIERAFAALDRGDSAVFDVVRGTGTDPNHFFGLKSGRDGSVPVIGLKAGSYCPANLARGMAAHTSTILLIDDATGCPRAVVQANYLNGMRTAAANALSVRYLARPGSSIVGIVGWGAQAVFEVEAIAHVTPISRILAAGRSHERGMAFAREVKAKCNIDVTLVSTEEAVRGADIVVTVTPSKAPLFEAGWVRPGTHVSAMGADNVGKQEIPIELMSRARVFVDDPAQSVRIGECQHASAAGMAFVHGLENATLGGLINGRIAGRQSDDDITLFDSSGLAIQDIAAAFAAIDAVGRQHAPAP